MRLNNEYRYLSKFLRDNCKQGYELPKVSEPGKYKIILSSKWDKFKDTLKPYVETALTIAGGAAILAGLAYSAVKGSENQSKWDENNIQKKFNTNIQEEFNPKSIDDLVKE